MSDVNPLEKALAAIKTKEVQDLVKALSVFGLGVFLPHMHDEATGAMVPLPEGIVQIEEDLKVSFVPADQAGDHTIPVAWRWDDKANMAVAANLCDQPNCDGIGPKIRP